MTRFEELLEEPIDPRRIVAAIQDGARATASRQTGESPSAAPKPAVTGRAK